MDNTDTYNIVTQIVSAIRFHPEQMRTIIRFIEKTLEEDKNMDKSIKTDKNWKPTWIATDPDGTVTEFEIQPEDITCLADPDGYETSWKWISRGHSRPCSRSLLSLAPAAGQKRKI